MVVVEATTCRHGCALPCRPGAACGEGGPCPCHAGEGSQACPDMEDIQGVTPVAGAMGEQRGLRSSARDAADGVAAAAHDTESPDCGESADGSEGSDEGSSHDPRSEHASSHSDTTDFSADSVNGAMGGGKDRKGCRGKDRLGKNALAGEGARTLLISNLPTYLTQGSLLAMLEDLTPAMRGNFDFFYCPWEGEEMRNLGYATINFRSALDALAFRRQWSNKVLCRSGRSEQRTRTEKALLQGLEANLKYFSESQGCLEPRFSPLVRDSSGTLCPLMLGGRAGTA